MLCFTRKVVQLTLEQHGFELLRSTYMHIFLNNKYYSTTRSSVVWIWGRGIRIWRPTINHTGFPTSQEGGCPLIPALFKGQLYIQSANPQTSSQLWALYLFPYPWSLIRSHMQRQPILSCLLLTASKVYKTRSRPNIPQEERYTACEALYSPSP